MSRKSWLIFFALMGSSSIGFLSGHFSPLQSALAQDARVAQSEKILVQGHGRAISLSPHPGEPITLIASNSPQPFTVIPPGKKLVLTDVMYQTQRSVRENLVVNIANGNVARKSFDILFQVSLDPGKSDQVHLCSGYVIPAGNTLLASTGAGVAAEQYVSISMTGYLADQ